MDNNITLKKAYSILEISQNSDFEEIRMAYRKKVFALHPDRFSNLEDKEKAEEKLKIANLAYDVLKKNKGMSVEQDVESYSTEADITKYSIREIDRFFDIAMEDVLETELGQALEAKIFEAETGFLHANYNRETPNISIPICGIAASTLMSSVSGNFYIAAAGLAGIAGFGSKLVYNLYKFKRPDIDKTFKDFENLNSLKDMLNRLAIERMHEVIINFEEGKSGKRNSPSEKQEACLKLG